MFIVRNEANDFRRGVAAPVGRADVSMMVVSCIPPRSHAVSPPALITNTRGAE